MKIIYKNEYDAVEFDKQRYLDSLNRYGKVNEAEVDRALEEYSGHDVLHYSVLIEKAIQLLPEKEAKAYYEDHQIENDDFERLRRITGGPTEV